MNYTIQILSPGTKKKASTRNVLCNNEEWETIVRILRVCPIGSEFRKLFWKMNIEGKIF